MPTAQEFRLTLASEMRAINRACLGVAAFCAKNALAKSVERALQLVLEELISNTVRHGLAPVAAPIDIHLSLDEGILRLEYTDRGRPFDPRQDLPADTRELPIEQRAVGGLGWSMILHYCELHDYRCVNGENHYSFVVN